MSDNIINSPQIRFAGFTDAWEPRKLGEMLEERNEQIPENDEYPLMSFVQGAGVSPKSDRYDRSFLVKADNKKYKKTELGDFIYSSNNLETGSIGFNRTGKAVISPVYSIFSSKSELESRFIGILSTRKDFIAKMVRFRQGVVYGQWRIHEKDFLDIKITVPRHEEKKEIIDFFLNLDNLITLYKCKYDKLVTVKKSMLEKMFPKEGANVPEIRFAKFTDAWEQRRFSAVLDFSIPNNTLSRAGLNYDKGEVKNIHYGDILVKFDSIVDINSDDVPWVTDGKPEDYKNQWLQNGDVIIADTAEDETTGKAVEVTGITNNYAVSGLHTMVARPNQKFAPKYLGYYLNSPAYHNTLLPLMQGIKVLSLNKANIAKTNIAFPKDVEEQAKIGSFFENIDNLITLHQRELNSLKNLKKSLLQQMFI
ncbi:restriction endonuclease subunit S [Bacillus pumilus]|uniref:restriction endonuclease subunit S n=1 Tax=Bacillus pumilus TaxID=1408 RepID=UPI000E97AA40|nr:restriction endonuclease subunit S [Bacillus pumilus]